MQVVFENLGFTLTDASNKISLICKNKDQKNEWLEALKTVSKPVEIVSTDDKNLMEMVKEFETLKIIPADRKRRIEKGLIYISIELGIIVLTVTFMCIFGFENTECYPEPMT
jgi:hypothetical protein